MGELVRIWKHKFSDIFIGKYSCGGLFEQTNLVYDSDTKVVYYYNPQGTMCPYISQNGKFCRFVDGKIVEI